MILMDLSYHLFLQIEILGMTLQARHIPESHLSKRIRWYSRSGLIILECYTSLRSMGISSNRPLGNQSEQTVADIRPSVPRLRLTPWTQCPCLGKNCLRISFHLGSYFTRYRWNCRCLSTSCQWFFLGGQTACGFLCFFNVWLTILESFSFTTCWNCLMS